MLEQEFIDLARFEAIRAYEALSIKEAKALKETLEPFIMGRVNRDVFDRNRAVAVRDNPRLRTLLEAD